MALSDTEIANMALRHLGQGVEISDLGTDQSAAGRALRRFYENTRDEVLREVDWAFARKYATLLLVSENPEEASPEWSYAYTYPSDCVRFLAVRTGFPPGSGVPHIPFEVVEGAKIYTTAKDAKGVYTSRVTNSARFPADFVTVLSLRLAVYVAPSLTAGDPFFLQRRSLELYQESLRKARLASARERELPAPPESDFVRGG